MIPHRQGAWNGYNTVASWQLTAADVSPIFTPLYHAVLESQVENARLLLEAGADLARDRDLLLATAREKGNAEMKSLLEGAEAPPVQ